MPCAPMCTTPVNYHAGGPHFSSILYPSSTFSNKSSDSTSEKLFLQILDIFLDVRLRVFFFWLWEVFLLCTRSGTFVCCGVVSWNNFASSQNPFFKLALLAIVVWIEFIEEVWKAPQFTCPPLGLPYHFQRHESLYFLTCNKNCQIRDFYMHEFPSPFRYI